MIKSFGINKLGIAIENRGWGARMCYPSNVAVQQITGGVRITWTPCIDAETEIWVSEDGGTEYLVTTIAPTIGTYDHVIDDGVSLVYRLRSKYDTTTLNIPSTLFALKITGGVRLTWDDNNTEAEYIEIYANIDSAGYTLVTTLVDGVETYDHTVTYTTILYRIRAREGTLPVYSSYSDVKTPVTITGLVTDANKDKVVLTFSEALNEASVPATSAFALAGKTINAVAVSGVTCTLTVTVAYAGGDVISAVYTPPVANPLICTTNGNVSAFTTSIQNLAAPATLTDTAATVGWWVADDTSTLTKDTGVTEEVTQWRDKSGSSHHLVDPGATKRPVWSADGILFDGSNDYMKANTFTLIQPEFIYIVVKQLTWSTDYIFDGNGGGSGGCVQSPTTPSLKATAGSASTESHGLHLDTWGIIRVLFNHNVAGGSSFQINEESAITGDFGTNDMAGFTLAAYGGGIAVWGNIQVKEVILRKVADDATVQSTIYNYLKSKYLS